MKIYDVYEFFKFWHDKIINSGYKLKKTIDRMISDKHLYKNESEFFGNIGFDYLKEVYNIELDFID
jgi:hypothetical protein